MILAHDAGKEVSHTALREEMSAQLLAHDIAVLFAVVAQATPSAQRLLGGQRRQAYHSC